MRSTTRQRLSQAVQTQSTQQDLAERLAFGLRVVLGVSTVVTTFAVLTQDPPRPELRWLLAFLATALFVFSLVESRVIQRSESIDRGRPTNRPVGVPSGDQVGEDGTLLGEPRDSQDDLQSKIGQLALHRADYVSMVSHELRTPLTSIRGFAELLSRQEQPPDVSSFYAGTILSEADRLARIVDDIIDLTRMESNLLGLRREPIPTRNLLLEILGRLLPLQQSHKLRVILPKHLPTIHGDRPSLEQVLARLLLDAVSRSNPETPVLLTAEETHDAINIHMTYETSDEQVARMSQALGGLWNSRGDDVATRLGRGDLGLYIARNLVEAQDGRICIEKPSEREVRMSVVLPR